MKVSDLSPYRLRKWSVLVRWRDRRCQICGSREKLQAHHINSKSYFPELAYDLDNGVALCSDNKKTGNRCHIVYHTRFHQGTRYKCTRKDWERFVDLARWFVNMKWNPKGLKPDTEPKAPAE